VVALRSYTFARSDVNFALLDNGMLNLLDSRFFDTIVNCFAIEGAEADAIVTRLVSICSIMTITSVVLLLISFVMTILDFMRIQSAFRLVLFELAMVNLQHVQ
jgi:hypothetical protein